jgi:hypothetical protein
MDKNLRENIEARRRRHAVPCYAQQSSDSTRTAGVGVTIRSYGRSPSPIDPFRLGGPNLVGLALADGPDRPITRIARAKKRKNGHRQGGATLMPKNQIPL